MPFGDCKKIGGVRIKVSHVQSHNPISQGQRQEDGLLRPTYRIHLDSEEER